MQGQVLVQGQEKQRLQDLEHLQELLHMGMVDILTLVHLVHQGPVLVQEGPVHGVGETK